MRLGTIAAALVAVVLAARCTKAAPTQPANTASAAPSPAAQAPTPVAQVPAGAAPVQAEIASMINSGSMPDLQKPGFTKYQQQANEFYQKGGYALAWSRDRKPTVQALAMIDQFKNAQLKGLIPEDYDASRWDERLTKVGSSEGDPARFDLAMTICAMRFMSDLHIGRVNPQNFKFGLEMGAKEYDLADSLRGKIVDASDVPEAIVSVEPPYDGYRRLEAALPDYIKLAAQGDTARVPIPEKSVHPGKPYAGIPQLVARLHQLGDLPAGENPPTDSTMYSGGVVDGVKHFQQRHGLATDGVLGTGTVAELNKPLGYRLQQLNMALERYRWIPRKFPEPPIVVNIPEFKLRTLRKQPAPFLTMNVVVGRAYRTQTPVFADLMRYVIFRPYWNVPTAIQRGELIPKIKRNPDYLAQNNYEITDGGGVVTDGEVTSDDLMALRSGAYAIRQKPGSKNALGLVKFIFPNNYNVYLHSTPQQQLFSRARRDFSHGCIRVEDPLALAAWVLRDKPGWDIEKIRATMNGTVNNVQVNLDQPIPVLILYSTAVVDPDNEVRFFDDIYGYDTTLQKALTNAQS